ncbi:MAG: bacteriohopanetetrol glucosamine biosynthesis glycosyltransferase HpnI [Alphaproteobacteria bacterium]|uniref:Bacteriohopanetetrol glucosamine biosynthesis glycosyltransferase HpnI n=1 Tax=Candidatus Nitrobium versatile TaxID=2884831 RepID=A0A953JAF0_9BACT|nr:bacteriohopanetetrol glucosamine biosynthesis glycosyltransferase HpnI [Candidatus Nitrobium versatile]
MSFQDLAAALLLLLTAVSGAYGLFALYCVLAFFGKSEERPAEAPDMPVSVLKPMKGTDSELQENLLSFCGQEYGEYEILLGCMDPADPALVVAERAAAMGKGCPFRTVVSGRPLGVNQKVSNLQGLVELARYPFLAISDSDMRVDGKYLRTVAAEYQREENAGLVTSLYVIREPASAGAALESLTIALDFIPSVLVARRVEGVTFGLGASLFLSKKALGDIGGLPAVADYLADDYQIGNRLWKKGYTVVLSRYVMEDVAGAMSIRGYVTHQIRWARTYRACRPGGFLGYGVTHFLPLVLLLLAVKGLTPLSGVLLASVFVLRYGLAFAVYARVIRKRAWLKWLPLVPLKDLAGFFIWIGSFCGDSVSWRGDRYRIGRGGKIRPEGVRDASFPQTVK